MKQLPPGLVDVNNPAFSVAVAYQDHECCQHARKTCDFLMENLGTDSRFINQMWRFDALSVPTLREMAARDAASADLILIACDGKQDLPADVKAWIELWIGKQSTAFAVVALFDHADEGAEQVKIIQEYLAWIARRGEMEFFAEPGIWPTDKGALQLMRRGARQGFEESVFPIAAVPAKNSHVGHWGLNE